MLKTKNNNEYKKFLFDTLQYDKIKNNFLSDLKDKTYKEIYNIVKNFLLQNELFEQKELAEQYGQCFYILYLIKMDTLSSDYIINECKFIIFQSKLPNLTKTYMLYRIINYFLFLKKYKQQFDFFMPMQPETFLYFMLVYLQWYGQYNKGAKLYYDIYINEARDLLLNSLYKENSKPKIAICFYGMCRGDWKSTFQKNLDELAKPLSADVFMFSWTKYSEWACCGGSSIWARILPVESFRNAPQWVQYDKNFKKFFPNTYNMLKRDYLKELKIEEVAILQNQNLNFKDYQLVNQDKFIKKYFNDKFTSNTVYMQYGFYKGFKLIEKYEKCKGIKYDYVALLRIDSEMCGNSLVFSDLTKLSFNDVCDWHNGAGMLPIGNIYGTRCAIKEFSKWYKQRKEIEKSTFFTQKFTSHESSMKYCFIKGLNIQPSALKMNFLETKCLKGMIMPDITSCLQEDIDVIKNKQLLKPTDLKSCIEFFNYVKLFFATKDSKNVINKNSNNNILYCGKAKARIQNQLSYKLGQALILNSKSVLGFISLPFIILSIVISHKQEQKAYKFKVKKNPNSALPPLETYPDYNEALKEKECFTYKLGEAFIKASKNWYGGGYIKFILKDVPRLKKGYNKN
ncbi:hypothetical protein FCR45_08245 [Campylobacter jejuni]|uniref:hypothetical protein n=1 Tax=Campylobacter jejuni TaxID=197 RepID=UPI00129C3E30|nr:hypothetical protein [Campylobacter jejuni]EAL1789937.1 hypothetical protein [Campylobacter jejuni]EDP2922471.1 hypothetical protein [Campylobacter jejuni]